MSARARLVTVARRSYRRFGRLGMAERVIDANRYMVIATADEEFKSALENQSDRRRRDL